ARPRDNASRTALSRAETELIYAAAETGKERAILAMGYGCGLRVGEMVACNVEDVNLRDGILIVPRGKGNKRRAVPMSGGVKEALSEYLHNERFSREKAFMLNERGRRMRKWTYNHRLQEIIERTGDQALIGKRITTHHLRHSIATHLLESGVDVKQVQLFLGHYHLETTQVYTHISQKQLEKLTL
ncbi:tyrosine-type recombinase/integrase, partial [Bacteroidales bacterium OttesenSCG-928-E04]|nr:tyrosine-type recombinase/integrase [Bacteroidales bacterium OttesenSCG-928-E04]